MSTELTACRYCRHLKSEGPMWYDNYCLAAPPRRPFDCITATYGVELVNCRDVNTHGHCKLYEYSGPVARTMVALGLREAGK